MKQQAVADTSPEARDSWKATQNWIAFEIGIASERLMDIWVLCDDVEINFVVPYFNNYVLHRDFEFYKTILEYYSKSRAKTYRPFIMLPTFHSVLRYREPAMSCINEECRVTFNLHSSLSNGEKFKCPACLQTFVLTSDWKPKTL